MSVECGRFSRMPFPFRSITQQILCALALGAPLVFIPGIFDYANLPQAAVLQVGAALALACALYGWRDEPFFIGFFDLAVIAWIVWMGFSLLWTPDPDIGIRLWTQWLAAAGLAWACSRCIRTERFTEKLLKMFFASGVAVATVGALQFLLPSWMAWIPVSKGPSATFGNRNMAVEYLLLVLPLGWIFFLRARRPLRILAAGLGCTLIGVFFTYALSRTGLYCSAFQALLFLTLIAVKQTRALLLPASWTGFHSISAACCLVVFMILANLTSNGFHWRWGSAVQEIQTRGPLFHGEGETKPEERILLYKNSWEMAKDRPLAGFGLGSFKSVYPAYARSAVIDRYFSLDEQPSEAHNDFIQFWAELGILGAILFVALWFLFFREVWIGLRKPHGVWCVGIGLAGVGLFFAALVNFPMSRGPMPPFIFFVYGILMRDGRWKWNPPQPIVSAMSIICGLLFIIALYWNVTRLAADSHLETSLRARIRRDLPKAKSEIEAAMHLHPSRKIILFTAARIYASLGDKVQAIAAYQEGLKAYPHSPNDLWNIGKAYMELNKLDDALAYYQKAIKLLPDEGSFHFYLGFLYIKRGELDKAQASFDEALRLDPDLTIILQ